MASIVKKLLTMVSGKKEEDKNVESKSNDLDLTDADVNKITGSSLATPRKVTSLMERDTPDKPRASVKTTQMSEELRQYLIDNVEFFHAEEASLESMHFARCVDHPQKPNHVYYEGYYHALNHSNTEKSIHPRKGIEFDKPAAPLALRAFVEAARRKNASWVNRLVELLEEYDDDILCKCLIDLIKDGWHFADLAVQFHFGDEIGPEDVGWHSDSMNSLLHMALSIQGDRALHSKFPTGEKSREMRVEWQHPRDVYVTSPYLFGHGVEYSKCDWDTRIMAVQCRFLVDLKFILNMHEYRTAPGHEHAVLAIRKALGEGSVEMPGLEEVKAVAEDLAAL